MDKPIVVEREFNRPNKDADYGYETVPVGTRLTRSAFAKMDEAHQACCRDLEADLPPDPENSLTVKEPDFVEPTEPQPLDALDVKGLRRVIDANKAVLEEKGIEVKSGKKADLITALTEAGITEG